LGREFTSFPVQVVFFLFVFVSSFVRSFPLVLRSMVCQKVDVARSRRAPPVMWVSPFGDHLPFVVCADTSGQGGSQTRCARSFSVSPNFLAI